MALSRKLLPAAVALAVALLCGVLAARSLVAAWITLPVAGTLEQLRSGEPVSVDASVAAANASLRAGAIIEPGRYYSDAALAAARLPDPARARALDGKSVADVVDAALVASPQSPHNWARRASIQLARKDYRGARASLETSILLGRYAPRLTVPRLSILYDLIKHAPDPQLDAYFDDQLRIAAQSEPDALAAFADGGGPEGRAQRVLSADFALYDGYLKALIRHRAERAQAAKGAQ